MKYCSLTLATLFSTTTQQINSFKQRGEKEKSNSMFETKLEASFAQKHDPPELLHKESLMIVEIKDCQQVGHFALIIIFNEIENPFTVMVSVLSVLILLCMIIIEENNTLHCQSGDTCTMKGYVNCCFNMEMHCASETIQELFNRDEKHPANQFSGTDVIYQDW